KGQCRADALSRKSGMIAGIKVEEEIIYDLERLDIELYVRGQHGYWASLRVEPDLISQIKEAQKEDSEIWTIVENLFALMMTTCYGRILVFLVEWHEARCSHICIEVFDLSVGLPPTQRRHDAIWVVVDRLTKSVHFLPIRKDYSVSRLAEIFQQEMVRLHGTPSAIVSDRDPRFASCFWKGLQKAWGTMLNWHASIKCAPFEMLYGRKCHAPICWDQVGECVIEGPEMIEVTNKKVAVAKEKLKEARTRQKSYADKHRRSLEF
nr:retrotransposable element Tf2 [Tanacetum cinerariifolium]